MRLLDRGWTLIYQLGQFLRRSGILPWYVNAYDVDRCYGGPEEGGWWYDAGEPVKSRRAWGLKAAQRVQTALAVEYPFTHRRYSVLGGADHNVWIEDHPARRFPTRRPHYE